MYYQTYFKIKPNEMLAENISLVEFLIITTSPKYFTAEKVLFFMKDWVFNPHPPHSHIVWNLVL